MTHDEGRRWHEPYAALAPCAPYIVCIGLCVRVTPRLGKDHEGHDKVAMAEVANVGRLTPVGGLVD